MRASSVFSSQKPKCGGSGCERCIVTTKVAQTWTVGLQCGFLWVRIIIFARSRGWTRARGFHAIEAHSLISGVASERVDCDQCFPQHEHKSSPKRLYLQLSPPTCISAPPATTIIIPTPVLSHQQSSSSTPLTDRSFRLQRFRLVRTAQSEQRWQGSLCQ